MGYMKKPTGFSLLFLALLLFGIGLFCSFNTKWGFYAHRRINRLAVFTLPPDMIGFYKKNLEYITEHAVDPDKRRYATKHEAVRHYIDIDHWGVYPFPEVPRDWTDALMKYTDVWLVTTSNDTLPVFGPDLITMEDGYLQLNESKVDWEHPLKTTNLSQRRYRQFFRENIQNNYYEEVWLIACDSLRALLPGLAIPSDCASVFAIDHFSEYGTLPYNLLRVQNQLTDAFRQQNVNRVLQISAEIGHYIGDAHVPLHTTENYNGQLTNQVGIHAFWESRLPELYAEQTYDFFVGGAEYIEHPADFFWNMVLDSHALLDSVLLIEKDLSRTFPQDKQYCYEERLGRTIRTQCKEYSEAYHNRLNGMVETRFRDAIHAIGCAWYTAWVDAGQPDLKVFQKAALSRRELKEQEELETKYQSGDAKGRKHE